MTWRSVVLLVVFSAALGSSAFAGNPDPRSKPVPVVVELFTSEGCSSCPPADQLLINLRQPAATDNSELILLGEHVDYWNSLGWNDRFSSSEFSDRQSRYSVRFHLASVYTPQIVVDGRAEIVGNDGAGVLRAIAAAKQNAKIASVDLSWTPQGSLTINASGKDTAGAQVMMAVTEDDLTTNVGRGENGGKVLRHTAVLRRLAAVGKIAGDGFSNSISVPLNRDWIRSKLRIVVWVENKGGILGAASTEIPQKH